MNPPYQITTQILAAISRISHLLGEIKATHLDVPSPKLRKINRIKTITASLQIEGNTLTRDQITAIIDHKTILAPQKDILEVNNAITTYLKLPKFSSTSQKDFLKAHQLMMSGLIDTPGRLRTTAVSVVKGSEIAHLAPPGHMVASLVKSLFNYLNTTDEITLIKSCVFHYELEFIHPFLDGNGRMGRLWQSLILQEQYPVFSFLPLETVIHQNQSEYYKALSDSDKAGHSTPFLEFMLHSIQTALQTLLQNQPQSLDAPQRLLHFQSQWNNKPFTRKDYLQTFRNISPPTASRDLAFGVSTHILIKSGNKRLTTYTFTSPE